MMRRRCWPGVLLLAAWSTVCLGQYHERPENQPHFIRVGVGFARHVRNDCWVPVRAIIANPGAATDLDVSIVGEDSDGTRLPTVTHATVWLPAHGTRAHTFYVRIGRCDRLVFELYQNGGRTTREQVQPFILGSRDELIVGLSASAQSFGCQQTRDLNAGGELYFNNGLLFRDLPARWQGYDAVSAIVLGKLPPEGLSERQAQAIVDWVRAGGLLIFSPGNTGETYEGTLFENLLPVRILGSRLVEDLPPLDAVYGPVGTFKDRIPLAETVVTRGAVDMQMGDLPLLVSRREGAGRVIFAAFDLASERLTGWARLEAFYRDLLSHSRGLPQPVDTPLARTAAETLHERVGVRVLPRAALAVCLGAYVLVVVVALRVMRKHRVHAFAGLVVAAPIVALIINFIGGLAAGVTESSLAGFHFVRSAGGQREAAGVSYYALVADKEATCDVVFPERPSAFPEALILSARGPQRALTAAESVQETYEVIDGDLMWLHGLHVRARTPMLFQGSFLVRLPGAVSVRAVIGADGVRVRVRNDSTATLTQCFVADNRNAAAVGDLDPGAEAEVRLDRGSAQGMMARYSRTHIKGKAEAQQDRLVNALYEPERINDVADTGVFFGGWFDGAPVAVSIPGLGAKPPDRSRTFWTAYADVVAGDQSVLLPKGALALRFVDPPVSLFAAGQWASIGGRTTVIAEFTVPDALRGMKAKRLTFFLSASRAPLAAAVEAYNWKTGKYDLVFGEPGTPAKPRALGPESFDLPAPEARLSPRSGAVRLRVTLEPVVPEGMMVSAPRRPVIEDFDLEIEGTRP